MFDDAQGITVRQRGGVGRKKPVKQVNGVGFGLVGDGLGQMGQADQQQEDEGDRGQQRIEGERAGQKRKIVFISGLQRPAEKAGGRPVPPAGTVIVQARGSSKSAGERRRARASASRRSSSSRGEGGELRE